MKRASHVCAGERRRGAAGRTAASSMVGECASRNASAAPALDAGAKAVPGCFSSSDWSCSGGRETGLQHLPPTRAHGCERASLDVTFAGIMPLQTVAALPMLPVMGHAQADDGNPDANSASNAITIIEGRSQFLITLLKTHGKGRRS